MKNFDILGLSEEDSHDENKINKAFKELSKQKHPDKRNKEVSFEDANKEYQVIVEARDVLLAACKNKPVKRAAFSQPEINPRNFAHKQKTEEDHFQKSSSFFRGFGAKTSEEINSTKAKTERKIHPTTYTKFLSFHDSYEGAEYFSKQLLANPKGQISPGETQLYYTNNLTALLSQLIISADRRDDRYGIAHELREQRSWTIKLDSLNRSCLFISPERARSIITMLSYIKQRNDDIKIYEYHHYRKNNPRPMDNSNLPLQKDYKRKVEEDHFQEAFNFFRDFGAKTSEAINSIKPEVEVFLNK